MYCIYLPTLQEIFIFCELSTDFSAKLQTYKGGTGLLSSALDLIAHSKSSHPQIYSGASLDSYPA